MYLSRYLIVFCVLIIIGCDAGRSKTRPPERPMKGPGSNSEEEEPPPERRYRERSRNRDRDQRDRSDDDDAEQTQYSDEEVELDTRPPPPRRKMGKVHKKINDRRNNDCVLRLNKDFGDPSPIFVRQHTLLAVNEKHGVVRIKHNETLLVACPGKSRLLVLGFHIHKYDEAEATCIGHTKFKVGKYWTGEFRDIECNSNPYLKIEKTEEECIGKNNIYRVGFEVGEKFHNLYRACFDTDLGTTIYVQHALSPNTMYRQIGGRRPYYTKESVVFGKLRMATVYKIASQRKRVDALLNEDTNGKYINEVNFLHRLQLAPRYDFVMRVAQRAAFTYINTAPQWNHITRGDWSRLERGIRKRAYALNTTLMIYTGTYGIWTPEGLDKKGHQVYLSYKKFDNVQRPFVPVPQYIYKLVYNSCEMKATAFISINLPSSTKNVLEPKAFCKNICEGQKHELRWLKWEHKHTFSFCCTYDDFVKEINNLPKLEVRGVFY